MRISRQQREKKDIVGGMRDGKKKSTRRKNRKRNIEFLARLLDEKKSVFCFKSYHGAETATPDEEKGTRIKRKPGETCFCPEKTGGYKIYK